MIVTRTPYRVSLFGGGTDYPDYFEYAEDGGAVLGFALDKYCYVSLRYLPPYFEHKYRVVYSKVELTQSVRDIEHPAVRAALLALPPSNGVEVTYAGDLPARSGVGSSSSFMVGVINALYHLLSFTVDSWKLAEIATRVEQSFERVGCQDQMFAAYGGFRWFKFGAGGKRFTGSFGKSHYEPLLKYLLLFYTGEARDAATIAASYDLHSPQLLRLRRLVDSAMQVLYGRSEDYGDIGPLLHESWHLKRSLSSAVATSKADEIYGAALAAGATGGKLLGAGGGGFMLIFADPSNHKAIRQALRGLVEVEVGVAAEGSTVLVR